MLESLRIILYRSMSDGFDLRSLYRHTAMHWTRHICSINKRRKNSRSRRFNYLYFNYFLLLHETISSGLYTKAQEHTTEFYRRLDTKECAIRLLVSQGRRYYRQRCCHELDPCRVECHQQSLHHRRRAIRRGSHLVARHGTHSRSVCPRDFGA